MPNRPTIKGLRRLLTRNYTIKKSQMRVYGHTNNPKNYKTSGTFTINSTRLKGYIGQYARVIVYVPKNK